jgi:hypothetical protein
MASQTVRLQVKERLASISAQAQQAQRMSVTNDNLCDVLDDIDNELQMVIELVQSLRSGEAGSDK